MVSFFLFAGINGLIHELFISPGIGSEAVLRLTNQLLPVIMTVGLPVGGALGPHLLVKRGPCCTDMREMPMTGWQVVLFVLVWLAISFFRKHRLAEDHAIVGTYATSYAALSAMEAPEPYGRMEREREDLLKSPRLRSPGRGSEVHSSRSTISAYQASDAAQVEKAALARAEEEKRRVSRTCLHAPACVSVSVNVCARGLPH